ncbi:MAG: hypothetical protein RML12_08190 [Xanthomonadales bacterium]|nr:hypothetical protein [Xanthomonadales bacterium]
MAAPAAAAAAASAQGAGSVGAEPRAARASRSGGSRPASAASRLSGETGEQRRRPLRILLEGEFRGEQPRRVVRRAQREHPRERRARELPLPALAVQRGEVEPGLGELGQQREGALEIGGRGGALAGIQPARPAAVAGQRERPAQGRIVRTLTQQGLEARDRLVEPLQREAGVGEQGQRLGLPRPPREHRARGAPRLRRPSGGEGVPSRGEQFSREHGAAAPVCCANATAVAAPLRKRR